MLRRPWYSSAICSTAQPSAPCPRPAGACCPRSRPPPDVAELEPVAPRAQRPTALRREDRRSSTRSAMQQLQGGQLVLGLERSAAGAASAARPAGAAVGARALRSGSGSGAASHRSRRAQPADQQAHAAHGTRAARCARRPSRVPSGRLPAREQTPQGASGARNEPPPRRASSRPPPPPRPPPPARPVRANRLRLRHGARASAPPAGRPRCAARSGANAICHGALVLDLLRSASSLARSSLALANVCPCRLARRRRRCRRPDFRRRSQNSTCRRAAPSWWTTPTSSRCSPTPSARP